MKIVYTNKAMNRQKNSSASVKTIAFMTCLVVMMAAIKVIYVPDRGVEEIAVMASITGETESPETEETGSNE